MTKEPCPKCGAPCNTTVGMRGGDHGWGTSDKEHTVYRFVGDDGKSETRIDWMESMLKHEHSVMLSYDIGGVVVERIAYGMRLGAAFRGTSLREALDKAVVQDKLWGDVMLKNVKGETTNEFCPKWPKCGCPHEYECVNKS